MDSNYQKHPLAFFAAACSKSDIHILKHTKLISHNRILFSELAEMPVKNLKIKICYYVN